jgi:hypothetical protein
MEGNTNTFVGSPHSSSHGWVEVGFDRYSEVDKERMVLENAPAEAVFDTYVKKRVTTAL